MHIEPGIVTGAKLVLRYATGIATGCVIAKLVVETISERGALSFAMRAIAATGLVFTFFETCRTLRVGSPKCTSCGARRGHCCSARRRLPLVLRSAFCCKASSLFRPICRNMV